MKKGVYGLIPIRLIDWISERHRSYHQFLTFLKKVDPEFLEKISEKKVLKTFKRVQKNIPAYQNF